MIYVIPRMKNLLINIKRLGTCIVSFHVYRMHTEIINTVMTVLLGYSINTPI